MKKTIAAIAIAAITFGFSANAKSTDDKKCPKCTEGQECTHQECKAQCPEGTPCPFEGIELTDAQKEKLQALGKQKAEAMKDKKEANSKDRKEAAAERREAMEKARREELAQIKEILTAEQYVQFLENSYLMQQNPAQQGNRKGNMPGRNGQRPNGPRPADAPAE